MAATYASRFIDFVECHVYRTVRKIQEEETESLANLPAYLFCRARGLRVRGWLKEFKYPSQQPDNQQNNGNDKRYMQQPAQTRDNQETQQP
jgi:hypothetical protein